jgi:hypothetical protein
MDVDLEDLTGAKHENAENVMLFAKDTARATGACVVVLSHLTGEYEDGSVPPPQSALLGKSAKVPEMVLNLYSPGPDMGVVVAKNRNGPADTAAESPLFLRKDLSRMLIEDYPPSFSTFAA